jgi:23S rRNA pseudouridine2605 synthase
MHAPKRNPPGGPGQGQATDGGERVAKVLARAGVASRRDVERLIGEGKVALNGAVLESPAVKVGPGDILTVDGQVVSAAEPARLFRYHKPAGLMTTHKDPKGRPTVFDTLPPGLPRLISVGRLDLSSEGLLLLTNDGGLARALELPATGLKRRYRARALGRVDQERLDKLKDGITVEGVRYGAIEAQLDKAKEGPRGANVWLTVAIAEGKNREVRRVLEALGLKVNRLIRIAYGPFALGTLAPGAVEEVGPRVIREQLGEFIAPESLPTGDRALWRPPAEPAATRTPTRRGRPEPEAPKPRKTYKPGWAKAKAPAGRRTPPRRKS